MDQREYWRTQWDIRDRRPANAFARRCYGWMKEHGLIDILELGCGDGRDTFYFAGKGLRVTAVDFSVSGIANINRRIKSNDVKNIDAVLKDIREIDFEDGSFDAIYAHLSLHYFDDETTTNIFSRLHRMLRPQGLIFIKCKSVDDAFYGKGEKVGEDMFMTDHLRHFFSKRYMERKLAEFSILSIRKTRSAYNGHVSSFIEAIAQK